MERKRTMASTNGHRTAASLPSTTATPACRSRAYSEPGHQLEKLEFSLAVAITRGDRQRIDQLREQIAALGGNREEPGT
jgi:mannose/cellobiose epimerase-like protein (N-acyl-D-glucosamine 2-epimerase family)